MNQTSFTPATIAASFSIPLYQRLFEWDEKEVLQLLSDLYEAFAKKHDAYYIGMFTVYNDTKSENHYHLVDGQQRFTVLTLMGIVFGWKDFIGNEGHPRLNFFARKNDEGYLNECLTLFKEHPNPDLKALQGNGYVNHKMQNALTSIQNFVLNLGNDEKAEQFKTFVHTKTTFFLSKLPENYTLVELNRHFERMNEAGKGLENYEILKVKILQRLNTEDQIAYTELWNTIEEMDKLLIPRKSDEKRKDYLENVFKLLSPPTHEILNINQNPESDIKPVYDSIGSIRESEKKPNETNREYHEKSLLNFPEFLLLNLYLLCSENDIKNKSDFFNPNKLLDTFETYFFDRNLDSLTFLDKLLRTRLLFDFFIIRQNSSDHRNTTFSINQVDDSEEKTDDRLKLIQFQSMLHVSREWHLWMTPYLKHLNENPNKSILESRIQLKNWDDEQQIIAKPDLNYGAVPRYWFWRLDYYLWENADQHFIEPEHKKIAKNYLFTSNRSIEHVAPRTPKTESTVQLNEHLLDDFGNLAMISAGQNSALQNDSFERKRAYVQSLVNKSEVGSIQSLKLLKIFNYQTWNDQTIIEHRNEMIDVLIASFPNEEKYQGIRGELERVKKPSLNKT